jgi:hypothetical protein
MVRTIGWAAQFGNWTTGPSSCEEEPETSESLYSHMALVTYAFFQVPCRLSSKISGGAQADQLGDAYAGKLLTIYR